MSPLPFIAVPILLILPGIACLRMFLKPRGAQWFLAIPLSVPFTSISAFALGAAGKFSMPGLLILDVVISGVLWMFPTRAPKPFLAMLDQKFCAAMAILFAAFLFYYSPPFEYFLGGRDPGIYVVDGIRIARTGSITAQDPLIGTLDARYRTLFFSEKVPLRYMGFQMEKENYGTVVANFFHLFPLWEAVFFLLFGVHGMLWATPFLACCLLSGVAMLVRLTQGEAEGVGSFLLLGANPIFLWFSRFPNSEMIAGALVFLGFVFLEGYRRGSTLRAGVFGSLFLALAFWARVDAALLGIPFFLMLAFLWMDGAPIRPLIVLLLLYAAVLGIHFAYIAQTNPDYLSGTFYNLRFKTSKVETALAVLAIAIASLAYAGRKFKISQHPLSGQILAAVFAAVLLYAYFVRPYYPATNLGSPNAGAMLALGWYFTHPVVLLALAGLILYAYSFRAIHWGLFSATILYAALYFYRIRADAEHYWMLRRYLPVICPAVAFFSLFAIRRILQRIGPLRKYASGIIVSVSVLLACWYIYDSRDIHRHNEFRGSFHFVEDLAKRLGPQDLLILGSRDANDLHIVGPMLSYYFGKNVLQFRNATPDLALLAGLVRSWKGTVYFAGAGNTNLASAEFSLVPVEDLHFDTPVFDEIYHQRPRAALSKTFQFGWYRIENGPPADPYFVDIGKYDDGSITGFHLKESYARVSYRWTNGLGHVFFPPSKDALHSVILQMNPGPWVPGMPRVHVKIYANSMLLVDLVLLNGYNTYEVAVPAAIQAQLTGVPVEIQIESKSWIPKRVLNLPDLRRVGVIVDWIRLKH